MREIKFRAWNDETMSMVRAKLVENESLNFVDERGFTLSQYTGLKDKSGKEIYEGDVVRNPDDEPQIIDKVVWKHNGWVLQSFKDDWDTSSITSNLIIIGNIYENPELIEK